MSQTEDTKGRRKRAAEDAAQAEEKAIQTESSGIDAQIKALRKEINSLEDQLKQKYKEMHDLKEKRAEAISAKDDAAEHARQAQRITKILRAQKQDSGQEAKVNEMNRLKQENAQLRQQVQQQGQGA